MVGALVHDVGKPSTTVFVDGRIRSRGHEAAGVAPATALLDRLNLHSLDGLDVRREVLAIVAQHLAPGMWHVAPSPVGDGAFRRLAARVELELLARVADADCHGRDRRRSTAGPWRGFAIVRTRWASNSRRRQPLLLGRHLLALGLEPGPRIGEVLKAVYERQLDGAFDTIDGAIAAARTFLESGERSLSD